MNFTEIAKRRQSCRAYDNHYVLRIIENAIRWAKPVEHGYEIENKCPHITVDVTEDFKQL